MGIAWHTLTLHPEAHDNAFEHARQRLDLPPWGVWGHESKHEPGVEVWAWALV